MGKLKRRRIVEGVTDALRPSDLARAAWLGGSDATERTDPWSDIDVVVVVEDDRIEEAFALVRTALEALSPIEHSHRLPNPPGTAMIRSPSPCATPILAT